MKISIFGATGMAGSAIVAEALNRKHTVIAASRNDENTRTIHGLTRKRLGLLRVWFSR